MSKTIYKELRNRVITIPSAQEKYRSSFINDTLDWPEIYSLPHHVTSDTKMREFQFKLLNKYLATNAFLYKIGVVSSPVCSFCGKENESLEHILIHCNYTKEFWAEVIKTSVFLTSSNSRSQRSKIPYELARAFRFRSERAAMLFDYKGERLL